MAKSWSKTVAGQHQQLGCSLRSRVSFKTPAICTLELTEIWILCMAAKQRPSVLFCVRNTGSCVLIVSAMESDTHVAGCRDSRHRNKDLLYP
jgi:hypothetical protein